MGVSWEWEIRHQRIEQLKVVLLAATILAVAGFQFLNYQISQLLNAVKQWL